MRPAYKQHVREFVKGWRAALVNHSLDEGLRLKDARSRPSGNPNCELFPQGPIIPVPPSSSLYRPAGVCGIIGPFPQIGMQKRASEPEGSRAVIPVISLVALLYSDAETASGGTRQHQNASSEVSSRYSHSFMLVCRGAIPIGSSLVVGFVHLAAESLRVSSRRRLGQTLGQIRKLFRNRKLAVSFFVPGTKTARL